MRNALVAISFSGVMVLAGEGVAANQEQLVRLLVPIFVAADVSAICGFGDPNFPKTKIGRFGSAWDYAQHAKLEVTTGLSKADADNVRELAAVKARDATRNILNEIRSTSPKNVDQAVDGWCNQVGKDIVRNMAITHDSQHDAFVEAVTQSQK